LTERTQRALWRARHGQTRHVEAQQQGELVCLDTFYIGKLKGVGKVWQITACDAACSFAVAMILPALSAAAAASWEQLRSANRVAIVSACKKTQPEDVETEVWAQFCSCYADGILGERAARRPPSTARLRTRGWRRCCY
jgi:hypothetical protein